jgi:hypothetical protein
VALGAVLGTELLLTGEVRYGRGHRTGGALGALGGAKRGAWNGKRADCRKMRE